MKNILSIKTLSYSLINSTALHCESAKNILYGSETTSYSVPKIWVILPPEIYKTFFAKIFDD